MHSLGEIDPGESLMDGLLIAHCSSCSLETRVPERRARIERAWILRASSSLPGAASSDTSLPTVPSCSRRGEQKKLSFNVCFCGSALAHVRSCNVQHSFERRKQIACPNRSAGSTQKLMQLMTLKGTTSGRGGMVGFHTSLHSNSQKNCTPSLENFLKRGKKEQLWTNRSGQPTQFFTTTCTTKASQNEPPLTQKRENFFTSKF